MEQKEQAFEDVGGVMKTNENAEEQNEEAVGHLDEEDAE